MKKFFIVLIVLGAIFLLSACATTSVTRVEAGTERDLSGFWNARDVRIACQALIDDALNSARITQAIRAAGGRVPMVIVGRFRNESSEHIDTAIISETMETVIFNSGRLDFVAGGDVRDELREERQEQQGYASEETVARLGMETGADFMMTGTVRTIIDREGNRTVRTYFVSAVITNIETNERLWMGQNSDIVKEIRRANNKL